MIISPKASLFAVIAIALTACGEEARLPIAAGFGPHPQLPPPNPTLIPTVHIAKAVGWPSNGKPAAAHGMSVNAFAVGLDHPRWLYVLPNGDVLVTIRHDGSKAITVEGDDPQQQIDDIELHFRPVVYFIVFHGSSA